MADCPVVCIVLCGICRWVCHGYLSTLSLLTPSACPTRPGGPTNRAHIWGGGLVRRRHKGGRGLVLLFLFLLKLTQDLGLWFGSADETLPPRH